MSKPAITVENLSKAYRIGLKEEIPDTLVGAIGQIFKSPFRNFERLRRLDTFATHSNGRSSEGAASGHKSDDEPDTLWALKDVSFEVAEGEVLGIIGRNGAGKSTLLKVLSRITEPTSGRAIIRGRVSSLLEVGTGFHPELSGRENVYMNGTVLGMTKREIDRKFEEIVDFSGVEKFLDTPVKRYSSGMKVRLAFAVAAHLEPEILIIDEVLAVGDAEFQKKCLGKMQSVAKGGRTVLFVSHDMLAIQALCSRVILLEASKVKLSGPPGEIMGKYLLPSRAGQDVVADLQSHPNRRPGSRVHVRKFWFEGETGHPTTVVPFGSPLRGCLQYDGVADRWAPCIGIVFRSESGTPIAWLTNRKGNRADATTAASAGSLRFEIPQLPLMPGCYEVDLYFGNYARDFDTILSAHAIEVTEADVLGTGKLPPKTAAGSTFIPSLWPQIQA